MLNLIIKVILSYPIMIVDLLVLNNYSQNKTKLFTLKNIVTVLILSAIPAIIHHDDYSIMMSLVNFSLSIIVLKIVLNKDMVRTILDALFCLILNFIANMLGSIILIPIMDINSIRSVSISMIIANLLVILLTYLLSLIPLIKKLYNKYIKERTFKTKTVEIIFFFLLAVCFVFLGYNMSIHFKFDYGTIINIVIIFILFILFLIYIVERNNYNKLSYEYDEIFKYVKEFENWIEKEQLNRHEFKNQLAVLRIMTKEKKVKDKIDSIINDNIDIANEQISILYNLPSNGLKGLLYYKIAIANKEKIKLLIDIDQNVKEELIKLDERELKILCRLIGIYFDNAIEEATLTKKKNITLEIYKLKEKVEFVISNSLKLKKDIDKLHKKGISTKGKGRGNGLYFASKMINENKWLDSKTDIKNDYYIQRISINNKKIL